MNVEEYKKLLPENAHLEGDDLWNAMEDYMLTHGEEHEYTDTKGRNRIRFAWVPEDIGEVVGIWDLVKQAELDNKQEQKLLTSIPEFIIFDVSDNQKNKQL